MTHLVTAAALAILMNGAQAAPQSTPAQDQAAPVSDRAVNPAQPDFTIIGLPTTLKIPRFASAFRVTHRFTRSLGSGSFGDLAEDAFGFDGGGQIGLEYRFGIMAGTQVGIHRTSDRTIEFFAQFDSTSIKLTPKLEDTFGLYRSMMLGMVAVFQLPTLVFFLSLMQIVTARWLVRHTHYAIFASFVVSALLTASTDPWNQTIMAAPMIACNSRERN